MKFEAILPELKAGKQVRRASWDEDCNIRVKGSVIITQKDADPIFWIDLLADDWEIYEEPIDWDYIIENKCLCLFWDDDSSHKCFDFLDVKSFSPVSFWAAESKCWYKNCRPVNPEEVNFYKGAK